jgi:hypothetical protein
MKLVSVVSILNQFPIAQQTIQFLLETSESDVLVIDNGSDQEFEYDDSRVQIVRLDEAAGSYPVYFIAPQVCDADVFAYFHSDFWVLEKKWDKRVLVELERDSKLGMIGFFWSNEIDQKGGRGSGSASNFTTKDGLGSSAEENGRRATGFEYAAVVDGCAMILRRTALEDIGPREDFGIHHFYDKLMSTQLLEKGWKIGGLGIECVHISGQTVNQEVKYQEAAKKWAILHGINPGGIGTNWDTVIYQYNEKYWLNEVRDTKRFIPLKVDLSGNVIK